MYLFLNILDFTTICFQHGMEIHEKIGLYPKDPGPSWKKWEDKEE